MDDENANLWEQLSDIEDGVLDEFANDPKNYGKRGSAFNPQVAVDAWLSDCEDMMACVIELTEITNFICVLKSIGWELDEPPVDGIVSTYWTGDGAPPPECSSYVEKDGILQDVNGNVFEDDDDE